MCFEMLQRCKSRFRASREVTRFYEKSHEIKCRGHTRLTKFVNALPDFVSCLAAIEGHDGRAAIVCPGQKNGHPKVSVLPPRRALPD